MNAVPRVVAAACLLVSLVQGQLLPSPTQISTRGAFENPVGESPDSVLLTDNDLVDGYDDGADLFSAPAGYEASGPAGSAFFQWGAIPSSSRGAHPSALWYSPYFANVQAETPFGLGLLQYRNGQHEEGTGAASVDLALSLAFPMIQIPGRNPLLITAPINLVDRPGEPDSLVLADSLFATPYKDADGNTYYLKLAFDNPTWDAELPSVTELLVAEGGTGGVRLTGVFTIVPEPSALALGLLGSLMVLRRRR